MKDDNSITCGKIIKQARESQNISISDLAFQMVKDKDNYDEVKRLEIKIKKWEDEKDFPSLDEMYQMAYIIPINPGELLEIRNTTRKNFIKEKDNSKVKKHDWIRISEDASIIFTLFVKIFSLAVGFIFIFWLLRFVDTFFGPTASIIEDEVVTRQIEEHTVENYEPINDGTVENMVKRKIREKNQGNTN